MKEVPLTFKIASIYSTKSNAQVDPKMVALADQITELASLSTTRGALMSYSDRIA